MQRKLSKAHLSEAVREILLSIPDADREEFTAVECEQRVVEGYGDFNAEEFSASWRDVRQRLWLPELSP